MPSDNNSSKYSFPTSLDFIESRIQAIDPIKYASTRNFENGALTLLGPYISRGVISTKRIMNHVFSLELGWNATEKLIQELAWRDYWQQVWIAKKNQIESDINFDQKPVLHNDAVPSAVINGSTGIELVDNAIHLFYESGYLHNHMRMYIAAICTNIGKYHWRQPAKWMYANLLDGDLASNHLSWQWVAGTFSNRKYVANQENINKYFNGSQRNTFLDLPYEAFANLKVPANLLENESYMMEMEYPASVNMESLENKKTLIYNYYNLDPCWHKDEDFQRVLLIEPSVFNRHPISQKCMDFAVSLSENIEGIQIVVGEFSSLNQHIEEQYITFKEHPLNRHYKGQEEDREWMSSVEGYYPGFFKFWNKVKKEIK